MTFQVVNILKKFALIKNDIDELTVVKVSFLQKMVIFTPGFCIFYPLETFNYENFVVMVEAYLYLRLYINFAQILIKDDFLLDKKGEK